MKPLETRWTYNSRVNIDTLDHGGRRSNQAVTQTHKDQILEAVFIDADGQEHVLSGAAGNSFNLGAGSPVSITHVDKDAVEQKIRESFDNALKEGADVTLSVKHTVLKSTDAKVKKLADEIYNSEFKSKFEKAGLSYGAKLVDDGFAWLLSEGWNKDKPQRMLTPDDSYGQQMAYVLKQVKDFGLNHKHLKNPVAVARFSNGVGDEYGGMHFPTKETAKALKKGDGMLVVRDKNTKQILCSHSVQSDQDMWLVSAHDVKGAELYATRMIDYALDEKNRISGKPVERIVFGFDSDLESERPLAEAIQAIIDSRQAELQAKGIEAIVQKPEVAAAKLLTNPTEKATIFAANNLWGDIIADLYPVLANNYASYDSALISDYGFVVETGSGGTAPDLLFGRNGKGGLIRTGKFNLNPIAIISGYAQATRYVGCTDYADALDTAIDQTLSQGYLTSDLVNRDGSSKLVDGVFDQDNPDSLNPPRAVDTRVFMAALTVNMMKLLGKDASQAMDYLSSIRDLDSIPVDPDSLAKYATKPGDMVMGDLKVTEVGQQQQRSV